MFIKRGVSCDINYFLICAGTQLSTFSNVMSPDFEASPLEYHAAGCTCVWKILQRNCPDKASTGMLLSPPCARMNIDYTWTPALEIIIGRTKCFGLDGGQEVRWGLRLPKIIATPNGDARSPGCLVESGEKGRLKQRIGPQKPQALRPCVVDEELF